MALAARALPGNAPGDLFVDDACIACDTCRRFAPGVFGGGEDDPAFVRRQPADAAERRRALLALVSCPVAAIGSRTKAGIADATTALPEPFAPGVYACGYAADSSFGAAAWLVVRPGGNVLVDSPRYARPLADRIRALGGARLMFLTHRDDVADHARWREALGCERILHARDVTASTRGVERRLEGDAPVPLADDLLAVPVPGHTPGSAALLAGDTYLFTGDHLWGDAEGRLGASRHVCWYDWGEQVRSLEKLAALRFQWVLPGHGRPWRAESPEAARRAVAALAAELRDG
ncbi:MBL fold metallo-hydrolase [Anaeromyxobacter oryzae]|uniref:MBL fold metallo-hydrolase n=1 Tax=Anaeromyxobacter oryzae TaxID=2918170 RepID=A0ABM7WUY0_9BACT|nr:MBL fold metallo-hydrolase [Anaeromyxobacter oryzae]BDG03302.1 MBL fold metallo-hydrolase [Anaeromyxobacter oryzae]